PRPRPSAPPDLQPPARAADNSRVTPSLRALLLPTLTSTAFVGLAIAAAFALVHAEQRRARRRSIRAARVLGARLEAFLAGRVGARALRRATWGARSGRFWSAVEALPLEQHRAWRRALGAALAGNPHSRRERSGAGRCPRSPTRGRPGRSMRRSSAP